MAVPKKRTSKTKKNIRKSVWKAEARTAALKALSLAKSILTGKSTSFIYSITKGDQSLTKKEENDLENK